LNLFDKSIVFYQQENKIPTKVIENFNIGDFVKIINPTNCNERVSDFYLSYKGYHCTILKKYKDFYWVYLISTPELKKIKIHKDYLIKINPF
jgi:ribosomal protein L21E